MSLTPIPTLTDGTPAYRQRVRLDEQDWLLDLVFNARTGLWAMSMLDLEGNEVVRGQAIVCNLPLLLRCKGGPPGEMLAISSDGSAEPPGLTELGGRVSLNYVSADDELLA